MTTLHDLIATMDPAQALAALSHELKQTLSHLDEEARITFITDLIGGPGEDKISSMVHL